MRVFLAATALAMTASAALAQDFSDAQIDAVENFWDVTFACAEDQSACASVGQAVRDVVSTGLCPSENAFVACEPGTIVFGGDQPQHAADAPAEAAPQIVAAEGGARVDGLYTINPAAHEAIAAGLCISGNTFAECGYTTIQPRGSVELQGNTAEQSRLLTQYWIYAEECQGARAEDINGWCGKRDEVRAELDSWGICMGDTGFFTCPAAMGD